MSILADPRERPELVELVAQRTNGQCKYASENLSSGDYCFYGNGPDGEIACGIEIKRIGDMLGSERSGRMVCQAARMVEEFGLCMLVVEGIFRPGQSGLLETWSSGSWGPLNLSTAKQREERTRANDFRYYAELDNFETSLELRRNFLVKHSTSKLHTAWLIVDLYNYMQKPWEAHSAVEQVKIQSGLLVQRASTLRMMAAQLPGIGWSLAGRVERHFGSIRSMINADKADWESLEWETDSGRKMHLSKKAIAIILKVMEE